MANVLGTLLVELGVNVGSFADGMSKATYSAKSATREIGSSFAALGSTLTSIGSRFGEFGGIVGASLGAVGNSITKLVRDVGDLSGATGALKIGGIGFAAIGAGAATAGAALVGIAVHASEAADHLYHLSESTGVSARDLSGLSVVAKIGGVDIDTLAMGLERLDRNALMAAESPNLLTNGFRKLGIQVTDSNGHLKSTTELFSEVASRFSGMEDGATKTAIAMQLFGRSGAALIPVLDQGSEAIKYWIEYATKVGAVLDGSAAYGAHAFHEELTKLELISQGFQNTLDGRSIASD